MFARIKRQTCGDSVNTTVDQKFALKKLKTLLTDDQKISKRSKYSNSSKLGKSELLNTLSKSRVTKSKQKDTEIEVLHNAKAGMKTEEANLNLRIGKLLG